MSAAVQRLVDALERHDCRPRSASGSWIALCPAHEDRQPSLSVREGARGRALAFCHAGCPIASIAAAVELPVSALFERNDAPPQRPATKPAPLPSDDDLRDMQDRLLGNDAMLERLHQLRGWTRPTVEHFGLGFDDDRIVFPVRSGNGRLLTVGRYRPGDRPPGARKMLAPSGRPRELFPAPEAVDGQELWLVEGEPDAISARELGRPGIAVPGASGWRDAWARRFDSKRVVVLFDCDQEAREAAQRVAQSLAGHAAEVRVLDLDAGRDDGYDLTDLLVEARADANDDGPRQARVLLVVPGDPRGGARSRDRASSAASWAGSSASRRGPDQGSGGRASTGCSARLRGLAAGRPRHPRGTSHPSSS